MAPSEDEKPNGESQKNSEGDHTTTYGQNHGSSKPIHIKFKRLWEKTGIDLRMYESMFKGALAPTIALSGFQATAWAEQFTTLGYLIGVITVLSVVIQPRAKFVQTMLMQIVLVCISCSIILLACYCCVQARINSEGFNGAGTGGPGTSGLAAKGAATAQYNSSASAVAGVWLFVQIYGISVLRARMPQYTLPCVMAAIVANVAYTYAPQFSTMSQAKTFVAHLIKAYLSAFGIATGVSLLVFPLTSRHLVFKDVETFISQLRSALQANLTYLNSLEETDMFAAQRTNTAGEKPARSPEAEAFVSKIRALAATQAKFSADIPFAKREIAVGKLGPDDLQAIFRSLRQCLIPAVGLSCMSDIFERIAEQRGWDRSVSFADALLAEAGNEAEQARIESINEWHELTKLLKQPFASITDIIDEGLQHIVVMLQLDKSHKRRRSGGDSEASGDKPKPGEQGFAAHFYQRTENFQKSKQLMLRGWCTMHDIELPEDFFANPKTEDFDAPKWMNLGHFTQGRKQARRELMVILYIEFLLYFTARRVYDLVHLVDNLQESGKLSHSRLVVPGYKRMRKWFYNSLFAEQDEHPDDYNDTNVRLGQAYKKRKDPEHLEPQNSWERFTNQFRLIAHFFSDSSSKFGFRVACATLSIGVVNYLEDTQVFFTKQRLFWAQIMTSIAMTPSAGQSVRAFFFRLFGTFVAMVFSLLAYYIVDGKTPGVLVFFFVFMHLGVYIMLRYPAIAPVGVISAVTLALVLGYELQVQKIGIQQATSNGQAYYPLWKLGLIRLATVAGGLLLAFIWTIFPYPITEHSELRRSLGNALYLVANYYSVVHETIQLRLAGLEGDMEIKGSPGRQLEKFRTKIYQKCHVLLGGLRAQASFLKYDIPVGGKFPRKQYDNVLRDLQNVLNFMSLVSVASSSFSELQKESSKESGSEWLRDFRKLVGDANLTSQSVTTLLTLLSASVTNGTPLPPYLRIPEPYMLSDRLEKLDTDILSVRHVAEPGYASFAVIQIGTKCLLDDLKSLLQGVRELVGELDFSYHIEKSDNDSEETLTYTRTRTDTFRSKQD